MAVDATTRDRIERFLGDWMTREGAPGVSVAVLDDEDVYLRGLGSRDLESNAPATPETLYGIASCTKSFTATAILQLAERGELDVHDQVSAHLPFDLWESADPPITIHDLLTHSSGIPGDGSAYLLVRRRLDRSSATVPLGSMDDLRRFAEASLADRVDDPGEAFHYNNTGYVLLGEVVAHRSGRPFDRYVGEEILSPLGMDRSTFDPERVAADDDTLTPYRLTEDGPERSPFPFSDLTHAAGGLLSSVSELADYLRCQLDGGELDGGRLLSPDSIERMRRPYVEWDYGTSGAPGRYGYGWTVREVRGERVYSHIGDKAVSSAYVGFLPERDVGIAVLANVSPEYIMQSVGEGVLSYVLGGDPVSDVPFWAVREKCSRLTGRYRSHSGVLSGTVTSEGSTLRFESDGGPRLSFPLVPETTAVDDVRFHTFAEEGGKKDLRVEVDGDDVDIYLGRWRLRKVTG